jgi:hypothetical protein
MIDDEVDWVDRSEYPLKSRYLETPSGIVHYIDEGTGDVILFPPKPEAAKPDY